MVPGVLAMGVMNSGTEKEPFTVFSLVVSLLMPAPVGQLGSGFSYFQLECQQCQRFQGLIHVLYAKYSASVGFTEKTVRELFWKDFHECVGVFEIDSEEAHYWVQS